MQQSSQPSQSPADASSEAAPSKACLTVFHDGSCPLCQREISLAKSVTNGADVAFVDVSGETDADTRLVAPGLTAHDAMRRFHVRTANGELISGAAAFIEMWSQSPRLRFLRGLTKHRWLIASLDAVYAVFLKIRPPLSRALSRYDAWRARSRH